MIPFETFNCSNSDKIVHFIAGNGFVPGSYVTLFNYLSDYSIQSPLLRPLWDKSGFYSLESWDVFVDDLEDYIYEFQPKIVFGHSLGASLWLMAGNKFNYKFDKIILIEPVIFPSYYILIYEILKIFKIHRMVHPMIKKTLKRQSIFKTKDLIFERYSQKSVFSGMSDSVLKNYIDSSFKPVLGGFQLVFSPEWEAAIYDKMTLSIDYIWRSLREVSSDVLLLKAIHSDVITLRVYNRILKEFDFVNCKEIVNSTHLLPFENPTYVADEMMSFINS